MHSTQNYKVFTWMSHGQTTIGSPNTSVKNSEEQRNLQALQNRFDNIEGLDAW